MAMQRRMAGALADAAAVLAQRGGGAAGSAVAAIVMSTLRFVTGLVRGAAATVQTARPALEPAPVDTSFDSIPEDNLTRPFFEDLLGDRNELPGDLLPEGAPAPAAAQPPPASSEYNVRRNPLLDDVPVSIRRNLAETTGSGGQQPMDGGGSAPPAAVVANPQHGAGVDDRVLTALGSMASQMSILIAKVSSLEESFNDVNARLHEAEAQIQEVRQRPARGQTQIVNYTSDDDFFVDAESEWYRETNPVQHEAVAESMVQAGSCSGAAVPQPVADVVRQPAAGLLGREEVATPTSAPARGAAASSQGNDARTHALRPPQRPPSGFIPWPNTQSPPAPTGSGTALTSERAGLAGQQTAPTANAETCGANASKGIDQRPTAGGGFAPPEAGWNTTNLNDPMDAAAVKALTDGLRSMAPLPPLDGKSDKPRRVREWLYGAKLVVQAVSSEAELFWAWAESAASRARADFLRSSPLQRAQIKVTAQTPPRWRPVESKLRPLVLAASPGHIRDTVLACGLQGISCEIPMVLFEILKDFAPGGIEDKNSVLTQIQLPGGAVTAHECILKMRGWKQNCARASSLGLALPDLQVRYSALKSMTEKVISSHAGLSLRFEMLQANLSLPYSPTEHSLNAVYDFLYGEITEIASNQRAGKALHDPQASAGNVDYKGKDKGGKGSGKGKDPGKGKGKGKDDAKNKRTVECPFFSRDSGCRNGANCTKRHTKPLASEGRCFNCGGCGHVIKDCPYPKAPPKTPAAAPPAAASVSMDQVTTAIAALMEAAKPTANASARVAELQPPARAAGSTGSSRASGSASARAPWAREPSPSGLVFECIDGRVRQRAATTAERVHLFESAIRAGGPAGATTRTRQEQLETLRRLRDGCKDATPAENDEEEGAPNPADQQQPRRKRPNKTTRRGWRDPETDKARDAKRMARAAEGEAAAATAAEPTAQAGRGAAPRSEEDTLLDSGASHRLRELKAGEPFQPNTTLNLAVGSVPCQSGVGPDGIPEVVVKPAAVEGTNERPHRKSVQELLPLGELVARGFRFSWNEGGSPRLVAPSGETFYLMVHKSSPYIPAAAMKKINKILRDSAADCRYMEVRDKGNGTTYAVNCGGNLPDTIPDDQEERLREYYRELPELFYQGAAPVSPAAWTEWLASNPGSWTEWELCSGSGAFSMRSKQKGHRPGPPIDYRYGWDLSNPDHQSMVRAGIDHGKPEVLVIAADSRLWSWTGPRLQATERAAQQEAEHNYLAFLASLCDMQVKAGRSFVLENPAGSSIFTNSPWKSVLQLPGTTNTYFDMCAYGATDLDGVPIKRATRLVSNFELPSMGKKCPRNHRHLRLQSRGRGAAGVKATVLEMYPLGFIDALLEDVGAILPEAFLVALRRVQNATLPVFGPPEVSRDRFRASGEEQAARGARGAAETADEEMQKHIADNHFLFPRRCGHRQGAAVRKRQHLRLRGSAGGALAVDLSGPRAGAPRPDASGARK